jgi:hypothetical protein
VDAVGSRALGWILEQHCTMLLKGATLEITFKGENRMARELLLEQETRTVLDQVAKNIFGRNAEVSLVGTDIPAPRPQQEPDSRRPSFDIEALRHFRPATYWCKKCFALWRNPLSECVSYNDHSFLACNICKVKYRPADKYKYRDFPEYLNESSVQPLSHIDVYSHARLFADTPWALRQRSPRLPPLFLLMDTLKSAKSFVHFVSVGITEIMMGILKMAAQSVSIRGIVAGRAIGENVISHIKDFKNESPNLEMAFWNYDQFRAMDEPHQKLIVVDGLLAFKGSSNLTQTAWRSAMNNMDVIEAVSDIEEVINFHNDFFSPLWARVSNVGDEITMINL